MDADIADISPRSVVLLGLPFHDVTVAETLEYIDRIVARRKPAYIATANLDFAAQAARDAELQRILLDADLVLCDGMPLVWASRLFGGPLRERSAGSDLVLALVGHAARRGHRLFFLGSSDEILATATQKLRREHPGIQICGALSPPRSNLLDMDHASIIRAIREARPDILLVALGCPKQEKWIWMHHKALAVPCSIGVGASLDFVAGAFHRAPDWMAGMGVEWLYRLMQEPRRLLGRYTRDLIFLATALLRQSLALRRARRTAPSAASPAAATDVVLNWNGRADADAVLAGSLPLPAPQSPTRWIALDLSCVAFMDSTGVAHLLRARRICSAAGAELILLRPSPQVAALLAALFLRRVFRIQDAPPAHGEAPDVVASVEWNAGQASIDVLFAGELTVATAQAARERIAAEWGRRPEARLLRARCAGLRFMDSSGLGALLSLSKLAAARPGSRLVLQDPPPNVRGVIDMARLGAAFEVCSP